MPLEEPFKVKVAKSENHQYNDDDESSQTAQRLVNIDDENEGNFVTEVRKTISKEEIYVPITLSNSTSIVPSGCVNNAGKTILMKTQKVKETTV